MKVIVTISVLACLLAASCTNKEPAAATSTRTETSDEIILSPEQIKQAGITTGALSAQSMNETLQLNGLVDVPPQNIVSISFPLGGYLRSTHLLPGMHVNKGESIAIMEDQALVQLQQEYLVTKTKLQLTELEYQRQKELNSSKTSSDKIYEQAYADYESNRILLMGLAEKLRLIHINPDKLDGSAISRRVSIFSPINGYVSKVNINIGKYVQPQDVLFELINPSDIHAALTVFEKDLNKVREGQQVQISFVDEPGQVFDGEIILVTKNVDENRSAIIHCHFEKIPPGLRPGMFITGKLQVKSNDAYVLPEDAVVRFENKEYVFVAASDNRFVPVAVVTGLRNANLVSITAPIETLLNKKIVTSNAFTILSAWKNSSEEE